MKTFEELVREHTWKAISNSPGRFAHRGALRSVAPATLADREGLLVSSTMCRDAIVIIEIDGGGLISYVQPNGSYVHTLCDTAGFARKLAQLRADDWRSAHRLPGDGSED